MLISLLLSVHPAVACGGFFHEPNALAESSYEETILQKGDGWVEVQYKANLSVNTSDFGWVIPIPGEFQSFSDGDPDLFTKLFNVTAPALDLEPIESSGCGLASKNDAGSFSGSPGGVTIVYEGATPSYDYTVLQADTSDALLVWLDENGWQPGDSAASIDEYVSEGGFQFVAVKAHLDPLSETTQATLPPPKIRYAGERLLFPARMARYAGDPAMGSSVSNIVYVLGDQRARISAGWEEVVLEEVSDEGEDPDYVHYSLYPDKIYEIGNRGGYALTYADAFEGGWVTRYESASAREKNMADLEFVLDGGTDAPVQLVLSNTTPAGCSTSHRSRGWMMLPLLGLLALRRRS